MLAHELIEQGLNQLDIGFQPEQIDTLLNFVQMLQKWNKKFNLTAVSETEAIIHKHLFDSLAVLPYIRGKTVLDIGSGAGFPGIPLAIFLPKINFSLLDSNGKKTRFLTQAFIQLGLKNVNVLQSRVEQLDKSEKFDNVICRAFAPLAKAVALSKFHVESKGQLLFMKAQAITAEIQDLSETYAVETIELAVPGVAEQRFLARVVNFSK
ncbi:MAG: 16S rRNA (guanine(527)-N(7))-methyltransferase RsmG [Gammaproteobacteria bacterium]|nr:16S rRNA (guanine(527)-N(7))-methyltransferase RsmG [Gammaproteobacteria bacterium]MDH5731895.1 16S rRNA (guanine(527)-N(7))-methyltransferase RsmG [Gammaproteobacteria bacterium]